MLDSKTASIIAASVVPSKLDYCNSLFLNLDSTQIQSLQLIQNSLARAVTRTPRHHHIPPVLKSLKLAKNPRAHPLQSPVHNLQLPPVLPAHLPSRAFHHPANPLYPIILLSHPFSIPGHLSSHVLRKSHRGLSVTAPCLWNDLPPELRTFSLPPPSSLQSIKHHLHHAPLS